MAANTVPLGSSIPSSTAHAISVSLPTWRDNVGYEEGEKRVVNAMVSGYPRFFFHSSVQKLAGLCQQKFGVPGERCLLFPTKRIAEQCRTFILNRASQPLQVRLIQFLICPEDKQRNNLTDIDCCNSGTVTSSYAELHIVLFPGDAFPLAKQFWQHSGTGISSRLAEYVLSILPDEYTPPRSPSPTQNRFTFKNKHYFVKGSTKTQSTSTSPSLSPTESQEGDSLSVDQNVYVEERYGRNLPLASAASAKMAMRRRIAGVLVNDGDCSSGPCSGEQDVEVGSSYRGVGGVSEDDVYLFSTGMSAIWNAHQLALSVRPSAKSVCFGFPYTDTLKTLEKVGPGCHFLGHGLDNDIDTLEEILKSSFNDGCSNPVLALFTEFPSNPLLRSADLPRLRALADKYDFLIVIDETLANFVNVEVLPYADIVVSSLSKIFSGDSNVMGGSLVLNPKARHYQSLKAELESSFEDVYFGEDAVYMERNSRDFRKRIKIIDSNAEVVCDFLRSRSLAGGARPSVVKEVFYPKWETREHYERCRIRSATHAGREDGGFGGLFSMTFTSAAASHAFFDTLNCHKGPSLGTNFTLACPYTILAHYTELEWAAQYGVEETLVRVSVGMEDKAALLLCFEKALKAAEASISSE